MDSTTGVVLFVIFLIGFVVIVGRKREVEYEMRPDPSPDHAAHPATPIATYARSDFERRLERQDIIVLECEAQMEYDTYDQSCQFFYEGVGQRVSVRTMLERCDPAQLHRLFAKRRGWCDYCKGDVYDVAKIVLSTAPEGARDVCRQDIVRAFSCCNNCGLMKSVIEHLPESLKGVTNILSWLEAQENASGTPALKEERLARLVIERERLHSRLASVDRAIAGLESDLHPRTDRDPFRDAPPFTEDDESSDDPNLPRDLSCY